MTNDQIDHVNALAHAARTWPDYHWRDLSEPSNEWRKSYPAV